MNTPAISLIAALGTTTRALGKDNELLWRIPDDLKRFKALTTGHPIIMGRKTFESIGWPLPGRTNIVVTRDIAWKHEGVVVCHSFENAIIEATGVDPSEIFVIGGAQLYALALPRADKLYLTLIESSEEGDVFFPDYKHLPFAETKREEYSFNGLSYAWVTLERTL